MAELRRALTGIIFNCRSSRVPTVKDRRPLAFFPLSESTAPGEVFMLIRGGLLDNSEINTKEKSLHSDVVELKPAVPRESLVSKHVSSRRAIRPDFFTSALTIASIVSGLR
ncbi:hypothetical protein MSAN_01713200 [Mycena sanguinolenta]|uniref:Uncharacterized protein n=1 Tax=Mycena sanguinolenta TaxID=230812 RepID=A0A8H6XZQ7_9AGAR|nr:hypothetical protein MSAN_01713200 [Mycena sanguinolenta]